MRRTYNNAIRIMIAAFRMAGAMKLVRKALPEVPGPTVLTFSLRIRNSLTSIVRRNTVNSTNQPDVNLNNLIFKHNTNKGRVQLARFRATDSRLRTVIRRTTRVHVIIYFTNQRLLSLFNMAVCQVWVRLTRLHIKRNNMLPGPVGRLASIIHYWRTINQLGK